MCAGFYNCGFQAEFLSSWHYIGGGLILQLSSASILNIFGLDRVNLGFAFFVGVSFLMASSGLILAFKVDRLLF